MKLIYKNLSIAQRQAGVVNKTLEKLQAQSPEVFAGIKFKVTDVYAAIIGFAPPGPGRRQFLQSELEVAPMAINPLEEMDTWL